MSQLIRLSRHGQKRVNKVVKDSQQNANDVMPESIQRLYQSSAESLGEVARSVPLSTVLTVYSDVLRTEQTARAILAGAYGLKPVPKNAEDLEKLDYQGATMEMDPSLGYGGLNFNIPALNEEGEMDHLANMARQRDWGEYKGVEITPFSGIVNRVGNSLAKIIEKINREQRGLVVVGTHAFHATAGLVSLAESDGKRRIEDLSPLGGAFEMEEYVDLIIEGNNGHVIRNGKKIMDLNINNYLSTYAPQAA